LREVTVEPVEIDYKNAFRRRQLNQPKTSKMRIKIGRLCVETDELPARQILNRAAQLFNRGDKLILRVHSGKSTTSWELLVNRRRDR